MKKKPYDVYSPEIYPRLLFVSTNIEDLDKYFIFLDVYGNNDGSEYNKLLQEIDKYDGGADQVNAMCDMLFKKYEEYKKVEHTGGDREVLVDNIELSDEAQLRESECANEAC